MSEIERKPVRSDRAGVDRAASVIESRLDKDADVAVPLDLLAPENLVTLISVVRRPPELKLHHGDAFHTAPELQAIKSSEFDGISRMSTPDLGYRIASFLVRREAEVAESSDPFVKAAFAELEVTSRMLEHLLIKRTAGHG